MIGPAVIKTQIWRQCWTKILLYYARVCVPKIRIVLPTAMKQRLRGGMRVTEKVIAGEDGYAFIAALRSAAQGET